MLEKTIHQTSGSERDRLEKGEEEFLASYAVRAAKTLGRKHPEEEHPYRTSFQRDRDRIIHSSAFRRLEYKTQVFVYHEGDYYRTRLTHSLETAQIARTIARVLQLNQDLCETLALAHDLGHPPFGHAGEDALNQLMKGHDGFNHNMHGLRIVEVLEDRYPAFPGLNLTWEVREGIVKHTPDSTHPESKAYHPEWSPTLETLVVDKSDEIAYNSHDLDDGLMSKMLDLESLEAIDLWNEAWSAVNQHFPEARQRSLIHETIKTIINAQVSDLVNTTLKNLNGDKISSLEEIRNAKTPLVTFSEKMTQKHKQLKQFLYEHLYRHYQVVRMTEKGKRVIRDLFNTLIEVPKQLPPHIYEKIEEASLERVVCDYIVGMTDKFALDEHARLFDTRGRFLSP